MLSTNETRQLGPLIRGSRCIDRPARARSRSARRKVVISRPRKLPVVLYYSLSRALTLESRITRLADFHFIAWFLDDPRAIRDTNRRRETERGEFRRSDIPGGSLARCPLVQRIKGVNRTYTGAIRATSCVYRPRVIQRGMSGRFITARKYSTGRKLLRSDDIQVVFWYIYIYAHIAAGEICQLADCQARDRSRFVKRVLTNAVYPARWTCPRKSHRAWRRISRRCTLLLRLHVSLHRR